MSFTPMPSQQIPSALKMSKGSRSNLASSTGSLPKPVKRLRFSIDNDCGDCESLQRNDDPLLATNQQLFFRWTCAVGVVLLFVFIAFPRMPLNPYSQFHIIYRVKASTETTPTDVSVRRSLDSVSVWLHPQQPHNTLVITPAADSMGFSVFDTTGKQLSDFTFKGHLTSLSVEYNFLFGNRQIDILTAVDPTSSTLYVFEIIPTGVITLLGQFAAMKGATISTACTYKNVRTGDLSIFVFGADQGRMEQWEISGKNYDDTANKPILTSELKRSIEVGSKVESCIADNERAVVYVYENEIGIWKYGAEPADGTTRSIMDTKNTTSFGPRRLKHGPNGEIGGMALFHARRGRGYLLVTNPGEGEGGSVLIYGRGAENRFLNRFQVTSKAANNEVSSDPSLADWPANALVNRNPESYVNVGKGIEVINAGTTGEFSKGLLILQNRKGGEGSSDTLAFIPWNVVADTIEGREDSSKHLIIDPEYNVRNPFLPTLLKAKPNH
eukprot:TRINITY_DN2044_c0_g1_i1.p1 TRINITY_DN2044_c0_g1~~TRINITY_DN2044_c0_g1_i1.p1  ORF type:complete len:497 (+),score=66.84 TRINITY_DN2044_c0_g1_i1:398-1888(+)